MHAKTKLKPCRYSIIPAKLNLEGVLKSGFKGDYMDLISN